ncbi:MAG: adenosylcobinamide-GDP ribazoletransferase [Alphaproteobacteria bacterium]|nr:adenosylcobinamide-GDP ribazoletransferase [Alphaproteobacteria bacterium]
MPEITPSSFVRVTRVGPIAQLRLAFSFLTRLPVGRAPIADVKLGNAAWSFPVVGAVVGAVGAGVFLLAELVGLVGSPAVLLALAAMVLTTGGLHEDGLADTADGLGARGDAERRLAIMRDSRIGSFGALALIFALGLKLAALRQIGAGSDGALALIVAAAMSRAVLPALMAAIAPARGNGLAHAAGAPSLLQVGAAAAIGLAVAMYALDPVGGAIVAAATAGAAMLAAAACWRALGGQTGDTLGAAQQIAEAACLLAISATAAW